MVYESISYYNCSITHEATFKIGILAHLHMKIEDMDFVKSTNNMVSYSLESTHLTHVKSQDVINAIEKISESFETANFCLDFHATEDRS